MVITVTDINMCRHCGDTEGEWDKLGDGVFRCCQCGERNVVGTLDKCAQCGDTEGEWYKKIDDGVYQCAQCGEHTYTVEAFQP